MLTNTEILQIALRQSAIDSCCAAEDFIKSENVVAVSRENAGRRAYIAEPYAFDLTSYGGNVVACVRKDLQEVAFSYLAKYSAAHSFETPALHELDAMLAPFGLKTKFQEEYFLPDVNAMRAQPCGLQLRVLRPAEFANLYLPQWGNALCAARRENDVLCVGAFDGETLAAVMELCPESWNNRMRVTELWVREGYRRRGLGSRLLAFAREEGRREGRRALVLETQSCNTDAIAFYLHEGLSLIGLDTCCYSNEDIARGEVRLELGAAL